VRDGRKKLFKKNKKAEKKAVTSCLATNSHTAGTGGIAVVSTLVDLVRAKGEAFKSERQV